jgi:hypothetical protein
MKHVIEKVRKAKRRAVFLLLAASASAGTIIPLPGGEDVVLIDDQFVRTQTYLPPVFATGDFNGDGHDDLAVGLSGVQTGEVDVFLGGPGFSSGRFSERSILRAICPGMVTSLVMADVNADGRKDLGVGTERAGEAHVMFGFAGPGREVDLRVSTADIKILTQSPLSYGRAMLVSGDFNGDGVDDLAVGAGQASGLGRLFSGVVYLMFGSPGLPTGVMDPTPGNIWPRIVGSGVQSSLGYWVKVADVDGDGRDDVLAFDGNGGVSRLNVFRGRAVWPATWDLAATPPDRRISAPTLNDHFTLGRGVDLTGDGRDEGLMFTASSPAGNHAWVMPNDMLSSTGAVTLSTATFVEQLAGTTLNLTTELMAGDVDGDGRPDLLTAGPTPFAALTTDAGGSLVAFPASSPSLTFAGDVLSAGLGDVNGDGRSDFLFYRAYASTTSTSGYGEVGVVYGYRPLRSPRVVLSPRAGSRRADAALTATGEPAAMWLTGDIADPFRDQWIPYAPTAVVTWTAAEGPKTLRVKFRTAGGRESDWVQASSIVEAGETPILVPVTNRSRNGETIRLDCHVTERTRVRAWIYDGDGVELDRLMDEESNPGIVTVPWDVTNRSGRRVAPGRYFIVVEWNGRVERRDVLVER